MEKSKTTPKKNMQRRHWRKCDMCGFDHKVYPAVYHHTFLPANYSETGYVCDDHLAEDLTYYQRMAERVSKELQRREQINRQAGF
jgi:hypothetical protein